MKQQCVTDGLSCRRKKIIIFTTLQPLTVEISHKGQRSHYQNQQVNQWTPLRPLH